MNSELRVVATRTVEPIGKNFVMNYTLKTVYYIDDSEVPAACYVKNFTEYVDMFAYVDDMSDEFNPLLLKILKEKYSVRAKCATQLLEKVQEALEKPALVYPDDFTPEV